MPCPQGGHEGLEEGAGVKETCTGECRRGQGGGHQGRALQADVVGTELGKEIQEIKRAWVPKSDDKNKDKEKKGRKGGKKKGVNEVDAEESTSPPTGDAP